jgi:hypothetical protein
MRKKVEEILRGCLFTSNPVKHLKKNISLNQSTTLQSYLFIPNLMIDKNPYISISRAVFYFVMAVFCLFLLLFSTNIAAQQRIQATVFDEAQQPLPFAAVGLLHLPDSTLITQATTNAEGLFELNLRGDQNDYLLTITYIGYEPLKYPINQPFSQNNNVNLGVLKLIPLSKTLAEAVITANREPVQIRGDTMAFDAKAYGTQPNDMAAELVKKLPGVEIDKDGTIQAQGEQVQQILVNGKPFFGTDPQVALQNLPADAIESIEIYDKKSDQAEFTGVDDGNRRKTINIKLKSNISRKTNGRVTAGFGNDSRYSGRANMNTFTEKHKLTVLGSANNVNRSGFGEEDFSAFTGQNNRNSGSTSQRTQQNTSKGFQEVQSGGANYTGEFSKKTDITASYFYNNQKTLTDRLLDRQNFLTSGVVFTHSNSINNTTNGNHRFNAQLEHKIDSLTSIRFTGSFSRSNNFTALTSSSQNLKGDTLLQNQQKKQSNTEGGGLSGSSNLLLRRKLGKKGRTISLNIGYNRNESDRESNLQSKVNFFDSQRINYRNDTLDQRDYRTNYRNYYSSSFSYTEPLSKKTVLETFYRVGLADNDADREIFNIKNGEPIYNALLSNDYKNTFLQHRLGSNLKINPSDDLNITVGGQYQNAILRGVFLTVDDTVQQVYRYILPNARLEYSLTKQKRLNFYYETDINEPSIDQLQPVRDFTDLLNTYTGNQNLRPEYNNRIRAMYSTFDKQSLTYFNGTIIGTYTTDKIANQLTIDTAFRRATTPVNTPSATMISSNTALGFRIWRNRLRLNWNTNNSYASGIGFINGENNKTDRYTLGTSIRAELNIPDTFELSLKGNIRYNQTDYSLQSNLNQWFINYGYEAEMTISLPYNTRIRGIFDYTIVTGKTFGTAQGIPLLSLYFSKYLDKNRRNEIRLMVVDVLNRNTGINRWADANYIQEERIRSLGRYGILTFTWFFNDASTKKSGKGERRGVGNGGNF